MNSVAPLPQLILLGGPTGSGKSSLAVQVAKLLHCPILSADSRQIYKELPIGTAQPSVSEMENIPHYFIGNKSVQDEPHYTVGDYLQEFNAVTKELLQSYSTLVVVGGTGLYLKAILEGIDDFPDVPTTIREQVRQLYEEKGLEELQKQVAYLDANYFEKVDSQNPVRLMRALEVCWATQLPYSSFLNQKKQGTAYTYQAFWIDLPREILYQRIHQRLDEMVQKGWEAEARAVYPLRQKECLQTVGYQEFFQYFDNFLSYSQCLELIAQKTRNYAKRQCTWFRKQHQFIRLEKGTLEELRNFVQIV